MKLKFLLVYLISTLFSISVYANIEIFRDNNQWYSISEVNQNEVKMVGGVMFFEQVPQLYLLFEIHKDSNLEKYKEGLITLSFENGNFIGTDDYGLSVRNGSTDVLMSLDHFYVYDPEIGINNMSCLSKSDLKSIVFVSKGIETEIQINYPTANLFQEIFKALISATQADKTYGGQAKEYFAPYLKEFPLGSPSKTTSTPATTSASSKATTQKSSANNTVASKSSSSKSTNTESNATMQKKNAMDEMLRMQLKSPFASISPDIYFSYPKASAELKRRFTNNCNVEYDKGGRIMVPNTSWYEVGGYTTSVFFMDIYNDHTKWSYVFPHQKTLSGAQNFCNSLASKIQALGIKLANEPTKTFPVYYQGDFDGKKIRLSASHSLDEYYISLSVTHPKEVSKSALNPVLTVAELFDRPLGAPKGVNPVHWFVENGFVGEVDSEMRSVKTSFSGASNNYLNIHLPLQGSAVYKGLERSDFSLSMVNRSPGHSGHDFYMIEFTGELKDGVYSWNVKPKQEKQEMKYLWEQLVRELMMQGHKLVKANKKTTGFSEWNPQEGYLEQDGGITRRYILTKKNRIVITEQKPYPPL